MKRNDESSAIALINVDDIAIFPIHHPDLDITGYCDLNSDELKDWWNKPYIVTKTWSDIEAAFEADNAEGNCGNCASLQEQRERAKRVAREDWFDTYPQGIRYEVRCLDGRSLYSAVWGTEATLLAAILRARAGPAWM